MINKATRAQKIQKERLFVVAAFSLLVALVALYMYFVSASVLHVVMRQEVEQEMSKLHSEISQLEAQYIAAQHSVSADIATLNGYVVASNKVFLSRTDATLVLSTNDERAN